MLTVLVDLGAWWATVHSVVELDTTGVTELTHTHTHTQGPGWVWFRLKGPGLSPVVWSQPNCELCFLTDTMRMIMLSYID